MPRRLLVLLLAALAVMALAAASAGATVFQRTEWAVSIEGKQTVRWSFAAERPENCPSYYGTASQSAQGSGSISATFATKKKRPLWAETYLSGSKLKFMSFSTGGWSIPAVFTKQGRFSTQSGKPCGSDAEDPVPLPVISDTSECGTQKVELQPSLAWSAGKFVLLGNMGGAYTEACPGAFEPAMLVDFDAPCTPPNQQSGTEGLRLQELHTPVKAAEFLRGKAFDVAANHTFRCEFPSEWPGEPPLKLELHVSYEVTFKPRSH
ncbi:MAG: hypothetical protein QM729_21020 [Solirubrobacterales bacterium]